MATNKKNEEAKAVDASQVPVVSDGQVQTEEPAKAGSGETAGRVNPKHDAKVVTVNGVHYAANEQHNLKNDLFDLKDADGTNYFVKDNS